MADEEIFNILRHKGKAKTTLKFHFTPVRMPIKKTNKGR
jgi:hypothetical protein